MTDTGPLFVSSGDLVSDRRYKAAVELAARGDLRAAADVLTHTCHACGSDVACEVDPAYGSSTVCISGGCAAGDCHGSSADCPTGQLCAIDTPNTCGGCSTDMPRVTTTHSPSICTIAARRCS